MMFRIMRVGVMSAALAYAAPVSAEQSLTVIPKGTQYKDASGKPLANGMLTFVLRDGSHGISVFKLNRGGERVLQPVKLDKNGRTQEEIFAHDFSLVVRHTADGRVIKAKDGRPAYLQRPFTHSKAEK